MGIYSKEREFAEYMMIPWSFETTRFNRELTLFQPAFYVLSEGREGLDGWHRELFETIYDIGLPCSAATCVLNVSIISLVQNRSISFQTPFDLCLFQAHALKRDAM